jgi:hypothetical protein
MTVYPVRGHVVIGEIGRVDVAAQSAALIGQDLREGKPSSEWSEKDGSVDLRVCGAINTHWRREGEGQRYCGRRTFATVFCSSMGQDMSTKADSSATYL